MHGETMKNGEKGLKGGKWNTQLIQLYFNIHPTCKLYK